MRRLGAIALVLAASGAEAHPLGFGLVTLDESPGGEVRARARVSGTEQQGSALELVTPEGCALASRGEEVPSAEERVVRAVWRCPEGLRGRRVRLRGLEGAGVQLVVRARLADGGAFEALVGDEGRDVEVPAAGGEGPVLTRYLALGARHIAEGVDHLAFVLSLTLWVRAPGALLAATTGFTVGHSATLAASALGALRVPSRPVEACIALSILLVAVELAKGRAPPKGHALLGVSIGALHGLGFAGALASVGLPRGQRVAALAAFNVGVELGQLAFIGVALSLAWALRRAFGELPRARGLLVEAIGAWAAMLLMQRVW